MLYVPAYTSSVRPGSHVSGVCVLGSGIDKLLIIV